MSMPERKEIESLRAELDEVKGKLIDEEQLRAARTQQFTEAMAELERAQKELNWLRQWKTKVSDVVNCK